MAWRSDGVSLPGIRRLLPVDPPYGRALGTPPSAASGTARELEQLGGSVSLSYEELALLHTQQTHVLMERDIYLRNLPDRSSLFQGPPPPAARQRDGKRQARVRTRQAPVDEPGDASPVRLRRMASMPDRMADALVGRRMVNGRADEPSQPAARASLTRSADVSPTGTPPPPRARSPYVETPPVAVMGTPKRVNSGSGRRRRAAAGPGSAGEADAAAATPAAMSGLAASGPASTDYRKVRQRAFPAAPPRVDLTGQLTEVDGIAGVAARLPPRAAAPAASQRPDEAPPLHGRRKGRRRGQSAPGPGKDAAAAAVVAGSPATSLVAPPPRPPRQQPSASEEEEEEEEEDKDDEDADKDEDEDADGDGSDEVKPAKTDIVIPAAHAPRRLAIESASLGVGERYGERAAVSTTMPASPGSQRPELVYDCFDAQAGRGHALDRGALRFDSRFESGNLHRVYRRSPYEYDLFLRSDFSAPPSKYTQWFYFQVAQTRAATPYRFNIVNMAKADSMYQRGLLPLMYSEAILRDGVGWHRVGDEVRYEANNPRVAGTIIDRFGYDAMYGDEAGVETAGCNTLSFSITFRHANDACYFAHSYPYTHTDLRDYLDRMEADPERSRCVRRRTLCQTLAGNDCDVLTITQFESGSGASAPDIRRRPAVLLSARVHPGETNASWMMKGLLDFLTGHSSAARILRRNLIFYVVPMLNPDGVIHGNGRCSLAGIDLNRQWRHPDREVTPTVWHVKQLLRRIRDERTLALYCDFHGHSRKENVFMYGCEPPQRGARRKRKKKRAPEVLNAQQQNEKLFPWLLSRISDIFNYDDCNFSVNKKKRTTARVVVKREFNVINSFTIEATFAGASVGRMRGYHFGTDELESVGRDFCRALLVTYCAQDVLDRTNPSEGSSLMRFIHEYHGRPIRGVLPSHAPNIDLAAADAAGTSARPRRAQRRRQAQSPDSAARASTSRRSADATRAERTPMATTTSTTTTTTTARAARAVGQRRRPGSEVRVGQAV